MAMQKAMHGGQQGIIPIGHMGVAVENPTNEQVASKE
jgi:hypothetical protein